MAASGGIGKSYLLLELAYKIATYERLSAQSRFTVFGKLERGGVAVLICAEDDATEIHNRLYHLGDQPDIGRLIVVPLPDAGGTRSLFEIDPQSRSPICTPSFENLYRQLKETANLTLVIFDPLQALCGALDLNLPQHGQFVCGALAKLAADTGAAVIVSHHLRKGGGIKTPDEAREAIRGSGGLVDGVRSAIAIWPENIEESKTVCKRLSVDWEPNRVCKMAVVKANFKADLQVKTLVRSNNGLLEDRSLDLRSTTPNSKDVADRLLDEIEIAALESRPFTKSGQNGIWERRHELTGFFHCYGKAKLQNIVQELLNAKRLQTFILKGKPRSSKIWLGKPTGALSEFSINDAGTPPQDPELSA